jgi:flagellar biosynthesis protein FlhB
MAEDMGDKTEAPTPKRRQEAREQGNIPRSPDLTAAVLLVGMLMLLHAFGGGIVAALRTIMEEMLSLRSLSDSNAVGVGSIFMRIIGHVAVAMAPLLVGTLILAVVANIAQTGLAFSGKRIQPNLAALNPFRGIGKIFGGGQGTMKLVMSLMKVALVGLMAYSAVHGRLGEIVLVQQLSFLQIFGLAAGIIYAIALRIGVLLLVLALLDYIWQRHHIEKELKMTKQEVKEEMKRMEGDPHIKARRRQIAIAQLRERLKNDVPKADVVVTNPTHYAVALKYDAATMHAPRVVAKGQGYIAQRIREIAVANGIPILERKPLARALYKLCNVGQEIPEQFFSAVAEILAYVYELSGKLRQKQTAGV